MLRRGQRALARGDHAAAIEAFADAPAWRARALAAAGRDEEAERAAREAVVRMPASHVPHLELGILRLDRGEPKLARAAFDEAVKIDPANPLARGFAALARWDEDPAKSLSEILAIGGIQSSRFQARWLLAVEKSWQAGAKIALPESVLAEGEPRGFALRRAHSDLAKLEKFVAKKRARSAVLRLAYLQEDASGVREPEFRKRVAAARIATAALLEEERRAITGEMSEDARERDRDVLFEIASTFVDGGDPRSGRDALDAWIDSWHASKRPKSETFSARIVFMARAEVDLLDRKPTDALERVAIARSLEGPLSPDLARELDRLEGSARAVLDTRRALALLERLFARTLTRVEDRVRKLWA